MTNPYRLSRSRRNILKTGTIGSIFLLCGGTLQKAAQSQQGAGLEPFKRLLPIPPTLKPVRSDATTDYYEITLRKQFSEIIPGTRTEIWLAPRQHDVPSFSGVATYSAPWSK